MDGLLTSAFFCSMSYHQQGVYIDRIYRHDVYRFSIRVSGIQRSYLHANVCTLAINNG